MKSLLAFVKKEVLEQIRSGKMLVLVILFILFGIMNPAIAKLTPWMMELMSDSLAESGFTINNIEITAMTSWTQFYKNIPILLIIFLIMSGGILTAEYQKGTLINVITKGLKRWKIILAKLGIMCLFWTIGYWTCYGITYAYNAYFWDNSIAEHLGFSAFGFYLIGLWLITVIPLASTLFDAGSTVILSAGVVFLASYLPGLLHACKEYVPTYLMTTSGLLNGTGKITDYTISISITVLLIVINTLLSVVLFNRKKL